MMLGAKSRSDQAVPHFHRSGRPPFPGVIVTINPQAANYVLTLRRKGGQRSSMFAFGGLTGLALSAAMKVDGASLFDRNGDMVYAVKERSVKNAVTKLCPYIIKPVGHS
jgi:hypothetical protein